MLVYKKYLLIKGGEETHIIPAVLWEVQPDFGDGTGWDHHPVPVLQDTPAPPDQGPVSKVPVAAGKDSSVHGELVLWSLANEKCVLYSK